jgi:hypothetical protein
LLWWYFLKKSHRNAPCVHYSAQRRVGLIVRVFPGRMKRTTRLRFGYYLKSTIAGRDYVVRDLFVMLFTTLLLPFMATIAWSINLFMMDLTSRRPWPASPAISRRLLANFTSFLSPVRYQLYISLFRFLNFSLSVSTALSQLYVHGRDLERLSCVYLDCVCFIAFTAHSTPKRFDWLTILY